MHLRKESQKITKLLLVGLFIIKTYVLNHYIIERSDKFGECHTAQDVKKDMDKTVEAARISEHRPEWPSQNT